MKKEMSPLVIVGIVVVALAAIGLVGWQLLNSGNRGPGGMDLSKPGVQPGNAYGGQGAPPSGGAGGAARPMGAPVSGGG